MMRSKVFVVSLHRTGTRSITALLQSFGLNAQHWIGKHEGTDFQPLIEGHEEDLDYIARLMMPAIDTFDSVSDVPIPVLYRQLAETYPDAKFLLVERDPSDWVRSVHRHLGSEDFSALERVQYWHYFCERPVNLAAIPPSDLMAMQQRHLDRIRGYFGGQEDRLGVFHLDSPNIARDVGAFLGQRDDEELEMPAIGLHRWKAKRLEFGATVRRAIKSLKSR
jgi:hypothetical protein